MVSTPAAMSTSSTQILISKYHSTLKEAGPIRETSNSGAEVGKGQDEYVTSFCARN